MIRTGYAFGMSTTPSDPNYINPKALAGFVRAFDKALLGWARTHLESVELRKLNTKEELETLKQIGINDEPTFVPRTKQPQRKLSWFSRLRYNRDSIRLRKYNREWIKNNIH